MQFVQYLPTILIVILYLNKCKNGCLPIVLGWACLLGWLQPRTICHEDVRHPRKCLTSPWQSNHALSKETSYEYKFIYLNIIFINIRII